MARPERVTVHLPGPPGVGAAVLTDYDRYGTWFPGISSARRLAVEGDIVLAEFGLPGLGPAPVVFEFIRTGTYEVTFQQVGLFRERGLSGFWRLTDGNDGKTTRCDVQVTFRTGLLGFRARRMFREMLGQSLKALGARAEHCARTREEGRAGERTKVLEIRRIPGSLEIWYRGARYSFPFGSGSSVR